MGNTFTRTFPTTPGAWQTNDIGTFAAKLDSSGNLSYSTILKPMAAYYSGAFLRVRNGVAYVAGGTTAPAGTDVGTPGAFQSRTAGSNDILLVGLKPDGSGPLFITALGGSRAEFVNDMTLDADGNIVVVGETNSSDFPVTPDAAPATVQPNGSSILARLDASGARLLYSSVIPISSLTGLAVLPDGNFAIAGGGTITKFSAQTNQPIWRSEAGSGTGLSADGQGNLYWIGMCPSVSGGSLPPPFGGAPGPVKLSADGARLLYCSGAAPSTVFAVSPSGQVSLAGWTAANLPTTPGVFQPQHATPAIQQGIPQTRDGFVTKLDLSSFTDGNFFVAPQALAFTWQIGEPAPKPISVPVSFTGTPTDLAISTSTPGLVASFSAATSAIAIGIDPSKITAGTRTESVSIQSRSNPDALLTLSLNLQIRAFGSFDLGADHVELRMRPGGALPTTSIEVLPHPGNPPNGAFYTVHSSPSWLYALWNVTSSGAPVLNLGVDPLPAGTYAGNVTVQETGVASSLHTVFVTFTVDPNLPLPTVASVADGASYTAGAISSGEIVVLFGSNFGVDAGGVAQPDASGRYPQRISETRVLFDSTAAPLLYVTPHQIGAAVPSLFGTGPIQVKVEVAGQTSPGVTPDLRTATPAIFTSDASGKGFAAALNILSDGSAVANGPQHPAVAGGVVALYGTGLGALSPSCPDGALAGLPLPKFVGKIQVSVGGRDAEVLYAGAAPSAICGLAQINMRVPVDVPSDSAPVTVTVNGIPSQPTVTLAIQ